MNIHIIINEKFTEKFVDLIDQNYPPKSNIIYIYGNEGKECCIKSLNAIYVDKMDEIYLKQLDNNGKLFVHGFYDHRLIRFLYFNRYKLDRKRVVLIIWGADLYDAHYRLQDRKLKFGDWLREELYEYLKKKVIANATIFMTFAESDYELAKKWYKAYGKQFDCLYPSNVNITQLDNLKNTYISDQCIRILVGNSATETNQHKEILNVLTKFAMENIKIICPLSYGDLQYGKQIAELGDKLFGEKFVPITEYMLPDEYAELLNSVQVAIFNNNRQQGTGNIEILAYLGKKVYVRSDTTTWKHYVIRDKCRFYDTKKIVGMSFEEFVKFDHEEGKKNEKYFANIWDINYIKVLWDKVMQYECK